MKDEGNCKEAARDGVGGAQDFASLRQQEDVMRLLATGKINETNYNQQKEKMKEAFKNFKENLWQWVGSPQAVVVLVTGVLVAAAWMLGWLIGYEGGGVTMVFENAAYGLQGASAAAVVAVGSTGKRVIGEPLTTKLTETASPGLLRNEIDDRVVKIRPMSTPLDQISRYGGARGCGSMKVEYYSVDTKPGSVKLLNAYAPSTDDREDATAGLRVDLRTECNDAFPPSTTVLVPSVKTGDGGSLVLYVESSDASKVTVVNAVEGEKIPAIAKGAELVRMGRAAAELDVMTSQFEALPQKSYNLCQIFKAQVEQSTFMKISNKEVGWTFSDQEEAAIIDMRLGMEKSFLFGRRGRLTDSTKGEEVLLTGGIWTQTDNEFAYSSTAQLDEEWLVKLCRQAFRHNAGSSKKVLLAGSDLIEKLHLCGSKRVLVNDAVVTKWGLDFTEIHSKFGTLYVMLSEVFDQCGMPGAGMVIDPEYITKYAHVPFRTEKLNLRQSGVRNVDAIVITEASCLVLRYPQSHMRIVAQ